MNFKSLSIVNCQLSITLVVLCSGVLRAQPLPLDERGKVSFYEVVRADSMKAGVLYANAKTWLLAGNYVLVEADSAAGRLVASRALAVYDKGYVTKKLHGKVHYRLTLEVKEQKYRYQFTDFVFAYYKENRYYRMVPADKSKDLAETTAPGWQNLWQKHRMNAQLEVEEDIRQLKTAALVRPKAAGEPARKSEESW